MAGDPRRQGHGQRRRPGPRLAAPQRGRRRRRRTGTRTGELYDIADMLAFEDRGDYVYVAGDCTRAYSPKKLEYFTRQIVFLRPGTFVIFDRVVSPEPEFKKTWLLQAMKRPEGTPPNLVITNGKGRLFVQTLLPRDAEVQARRRRGPVPLRRAELSAAARHRAGARVPHRGLALEAGPGGLLPARLDGHGQLGESVPRPSCGKPNADVRVSTGRHGRVFREGSCGRLRRDRGTAGAFYRRRSSCRNGRFGGDAERSWGKPRYETQAYRRNRKDEIRDKFESHQMQMTQRAPPKADDKPFFRCF